LKQQHVPTDDNVELTVECQLSRITVHKRDVGCGRRDRPLPSGGDRRSLAVDPQDLTRLSDDFGRDECHITRAAPNIEDAHAGLDTTVAHETASDGPDESRLYLKPGQFTIGVAKYVRSLGLSRHL
jgi:hypothetical protein